MTDPARRQRPGSAEDEPYGLLSAVGYAIRLIWSADRRGLLMTLGCQLASTAILVAVVLIGREVLGQALAVRDAGASAGAGTIPIIAVAVGLSTLGGLLRIVVSARQRVLAVLVDRHIINLLLRTTSRSDLAEFETTDFQNRLQRAVFASRSQPAMVVTAMVAAVQGILTIGAVMLILAHLAWWLLPVAVVGALPVLRAARDERRAGYSLNREMAETRRTRQYLERLLTGWQEAKELRSLRLGDLLRERWAAQYRTEIDDTVAVNRRHVGRKVLARLAGDVVTIVVVAIMWWQVTVGRIDVPTALAVLVALWQLSIRMQLIGAMFNGVGESVLYLTDLRFFDRPTVPTGHLENAVDFRGLTVRGLGFRYPGAERDALSDVDLDLRPGEVVALVGANGSGKTTLAKLLAGLYRPDQGSVVHGDRTVDDLEELRQLTAVVFQDFVRYRLSALDNIAFGRADQPVDRDEVRQAAQFAGLDQVLDRLPAGYETPLSMEFTGGTDLSGGQWQRLALARAFYRNAPLVILDEPTAALDPDAEAELFSQVRRLFAGRSVLLITHRFSGVRDADRICVLDGGRVIESGTHEALMDRAGAYARMFMLQADPYQDAVR